MFRPMKSKSSSNMTTPICRCRVLYLGSAVPHVTKDGLQGIQEPLREMYPEEGVHGAKGIDSWLSVYSNGLLLENVDEKRKRVARFFPIESLHYCAAVRHVTIPNANGEPIARFLPLDSAFARVPSANNPPLFACILRRTSGIKVLECHSFVCKKEMAANALVRCCFHSYADNTCARQLEATGSIYGSVVNGGKSPPPPPANGTGSRPVNPIQKVEQWRAYVSQSAKDSGDELDNSELVSIYGGDENHKVWAGGMALSAEADEQQSIYADYMSTLRSSKSMNGTQRSNRPRQLTAPSSPPPPPPNATSAHKKENGKKVRDKMMPMNGHAGQRRYYASEFRPMWSPPMMMLPPHGLPMQSLPPHMIPANLYRKLPKNMKGVPVPVPVPYPPHPMGYSPMPVARVGPFVKRSTEEPIYLPSSYPPKLSPEHYHMGNGNLPHQAHVHSSPSRPSSTQPSPTQKLAKYKKMQKSTGNLASAPAENNNNKSSDSESKFNTGIYKKKGHLNERAFSYSIRQEHRSRSHSSLSTLNFNGATTNGDQDRPQTPPKTNGQSVVNGKGTNVQNGHGNGIHTTGSQKTDKTISPTASTTGSKMNKKESESAINTNGVKHMMHELSLSDDGDVVEHIEPRKDNGMVSRRRIMAAANNLR